VEFPSALDTDRCPYDIQRATRGYNVSQPADSKIHLRIGLHLEDVQGADDDISGASLVCPETYLPHQIIL
jgi:hypothetical protein